MKTIRINLIEEYILSKKNVTMEELYKEFDVSPNTIRRDLREIMKKGKIKKVYGGVTVIENIPLLIPYEKREIINKKIKEKIALKASKHVENGDIIYIDTGTTTVEMIEGLKDKEITVVTGNLNFIIAALPYKNIKIVSLSGVLDRKLNSFVSLKTVELIKDFNIKKAFMATTGISKKYGITNSSLEETKIKSTVILRSEKVFLLMDSSKLDKVGLISYANFEDIDYIVIDKVNKKYKEELKKFNVVIELISDNN